MVLAVGQVIDEQNQPLPGTAVYVADANGNVLDGRGVSTNNQGIFQLPVNYHENIIVQHLGYTAQKTTVLSLLSKSGLIKLVPNVQELHEATVTAAKKLNWLKNGMYAATVYVLYRVYRGK